MEKLSSVDLAVKEYLEVQENKDLLRFITCGSVDDGKSTLIGRLLYESNLIYEDQLTQLIRDTKKFGTSENDLDLALIVDGLAAEREQGITIDVAYRFFSTKKRKFIVADTPGHEQYTRNMATGASTADLAIVMIDARKGVLTQTRRHSFIVSLLGIKKVVLAVNKMDLVGYQQKIFQDISKEYTNIAQLLKIENIQCIPVSSLYGDNILKDSLNTPWYKGPSLIEYLETVPLKNTNDVTRYFRMPVQWVNRPNLDFRGFSGTIVSGKICVGDQIKIVPSNKESKVTQIVTYDNCLEKASVGDSVTLVIEDEIDISRGDVITEAQNSLECADQFETSIIWMAEKEMLVGRQYILQSYTVNALCTIDQPKYRIDVNTFSHIPSKTLNLNEIGVCNIILNRRIAFEPYSMNSALGSFILIDRITNETVAAGIIHHALRRSTNVSTQYFSIDQEIRSLIKAQKPCVIWMTGLSGSGKSTIANNVEVRLNQISKHTIVLDGDNLRQGLNKDLGFTTQDRIENLRRVAEVSKLMVEAGLITIVSLISPFRAEREMAREIIGKDNFIEVYVDVPLEEAEKRDPKGLYKKARNGEIPNFTGIGSVYEPPHMPDLHLETHKNTSEELATKVVDFLLSQGFLL
ncbi:MAG: adenylyl-sulfate kinase [Caedibacter sp. 37-49]|nr:MAG: adenylyl-sulfate kinase [Caedibacter sp. 37-49]